MAGIVGMKRTPVHGHTINRKKSPTYKTWDNMKNRCYRKTATKFKFYGGRGIKLCSRWLGKLGFNNFLADMGEKPSIEHSIDRIDPDKNYSPENCRWILLSENRFRGRD